jgi:Transcriptional regulator
MIKEKIINCTIKCLQRDGLRFSIDLIAKELKISKKTIYKNFATKEELALAVYEQFYLKCNKSISQIIKAHNKDEKVSLLSIYYESFLMIKKDIFNKFTLNASIESFSLNEHEKLWNSISTILNFNNKEISKIIIDGSFEKLSSSNLSPKMIIEELVKIL